MTKKRPVLILDFGSQFTQLIARRCRELGVFSEIHPFSYQLEKIKALDPVAIVLSGGPASVTDAGAPNVSADLFQLDIPILGVCYGMQVIAHHFGGELHAGKNREYGPTNIRITDNNDLFAAFNLNSELTVWMSHGDHVEKAPSDFKVVATTESSVTAFAHRNRKIYGVQFHAEVAHTQRGREILGNFLFKIADCERNWNSTSYVAEAIEEIKRAAGNGNVVCALSGGVDSTVAAALVSRAIGSRLHCIFVDNGLLRENEVENVKEMLGNSGLGLNLKVVDASKDFLRALAGVTDPEKKRKIIGQLFIDVFDKEAHAITNVTHLVQGTLYPDVIESMPVRGPSDVIKSHHNVGGLPERMKLKLIEPLRELFKDEVRKVGRELGVPDAIINRQPFPGPGLAVRIVGPITEDGLRLVRKADAIFNEEIVQTGLSAILWQSFAVLLPIKSVGVMGDNRTYEQTIALRSVRSDDGMTASVGFLPDSVLSKVSARIINEVRGINRVVFDVSSKPPATIEWE